MAKIIAITNQKGGVGKTTVAMQLGAWLSRKGSRVLFVDMDSQCSLTYNAGGTYKNVPTVKELLLKESDIFDVIQHVEEGDLIPGSLSLGSIDDKLEAENSEKSLKIALSPVTDKYDYIVIDSPPTLGILTINVMTAADGILIPSAADVFSLQGIGQLFGTYRTVKSMVNPDLKLEGIILVRYTDRYLQQRSVRDMVKKSAETIGTKVFDSTIRDSVVVREATLAKQSLFKYAPKHKVTMDFDAFMQEFINQLAPEKSEK